MKNSFSLDNVRSNLSRLLRTNFLTMRGEPSNGHKIVVKKCHRDSVALLNLETIAVLAISKGVVQGIGHGSPQVIIRLVFA